MHHLQQRNDVEQPMVALWYHTFSEKKLAAQPRTTRTTVNPQYVTAIDIKTTSLSVMKQLKTKVVFCSKTYSRLNK